MRNVLDLLPNNFFNTNSIGIDLETTAFYSKSPDPHRDKVLLVGVSNGTQHLVLEPGEWLEKLWFWMAEPKHLIIGHNLKFDLKFLWNLGCPVQRSYLWDTLICERILTAGKFLECNLGATARRRANVMLEKGLGKSFRNHLGEFSAEQLYYAREDVSYLHTIMEAQRKEFDSWGLKLRDIIKVENQLVPILAETEMRGINLNTELWNIVVKEEQAKADEAEVKVMEMLGITGNCDLFGGHTYGLNLNSPSQVLVALQKFGIKLENTQKKTLESCAQKYPVIEWILIYRKHIKRLGFNYSRYINPVTRRIHTTLNQAGTVSGRLSSKHPNLQNVVGDKKFREVWMADEGNVLIPVDFSQQEARILAEMSGDENLQEACRASDIYLEVARYVTEIPNLQKGQHIKIWGHELDIRYVMKQACLATIYGATPETLVIRFGIPLPVAKKAIRLIQTKFPKIESWAKAQIRKAKEQGYVETLSGRRRWFPGLDDPEKLKKVKNMIRNSPVQGTGSCMIKSAIVLADKKLRNRGAWLTLTVHDEIVFQARKKDAKEVTKILIESMLAAGKKYVNIPMPVDVPTEFTQFWVKP